MRSNDSDTDGCSCVLGIIVLIVSLIAGGIATNYLISVIFHANIPFIWDEVIGFVAGSFIIPFAIIVWILKYFKVF